MTQLAALVVAHHRCDCDAATKPPGEHGIEHVLQIDGKDFPWYISEDGPQVRKLSKGLYAVTVTILAENVDLDGIELT